MKLPFPRARLLLDPQSPSTVHNTSNDGFGSPTTPTGRFAQPTAPANFGLRAYGPRTAPTFNTSFRTTLSRNGGMGHFRSALAAATLTGLAGTHEFPLIAVAAGTALGELLSRRRDEERRDSERVALTQSTPLSEEDATRAEADDRRQRDEAKELATELTGPSAQVESPQPSEVDSQCDWVLITNAAGDLIDPTEASNSPLDTIRPLIWIDAPSDGQPGGVLRKDYAYRPPSNLASPPSHNPPPQAQLTLQSSSSVLSFATAQTHLSHRPSMVSIRSGRYGSFPRSGSPTPMLPHRQLSLPRQRPSALRVSIATEPHPRLNNDACRTIPDQRSRTLDALEEATDLTPTSAYRTTRRLLIIGSNYDSETRQTDTAFSIETLLGVDNDIALLWEAFTERGYEVVLHDRNDYDRGEVLECVGAFVGDARCGDIRAIAFIGHGYSASNGTVMLIPPYCPTTDDAIPRDDWENNIRNHSKQGSIVFSIMAHCFSGDFMQQEHDCRTWVNQDGAPQFSSQSVDKSIFITFTSSTKDQFSFESTVERRAEAGAQDHFLYALAMTIRATQVCTWESFFATFKYNFDRARSNASWADGYDSDSTMQEELPITSASQRAYIWRMANLQDPRFSASEVLDYSRVFLVPVSA